MTTGGESVATGGRRHHLTPWRVIAAGGFAITLVNATSTILEAQRDHDPLPPAAPFLWEFSSYAVILALAPLVGSAVARWMPGPGQWARTLLIHAALLFPFSIVHIFLMASIREAAYWAVGARYGFLDEGVAITLFYEWRKDVLIYLALAAVYWAFKRFGGPAPATAPLTDRIEIRDGGAAVFLSPGDILWIEAAGNYVEFHTASRAHLVRGTLAFWELQLRARGFVRVHRSRLVNRARIRALKPTASGDLDINLDDGRNIVASRRYRAAVETPAAQRAPLQP